MADLARPEIVVTGGDGQVGWELTRSLAPLGNVRSHTRQTLDLSQPDAIRRVIREGKPAVIVNAAAYTKVDDAEGDREIALAINGQAPGVLAEEAKRVGALLVHFSTDYVFDGLAAAPYKESDAPAPKTVYGATKLAGDEAVLSSGAEAMIFRVAWVYGLRGRNFLKTIQRLARERDRLTIVNDQHGSPTWSRSIAEGTTAAVTQYLAARRERRDGPEKGLFHLAAPDHTTWFEFARAIVESSPGENESTNPQLDPIKTSEFATRAARPAWSVLDSTRAAQTLGIRLPDWRSQLAMCLIA